MPPLAPHTFIYTALPAEAKPLVDYFKLKKRVTVTPFAVYEHDGVCLTVTGLGKTAMAAGVAYTQALFMPVAPVMLNVGIAGHQSHALGQLYQADKIIDADSQKRYYPSLVVSPPCPTWCVQTSAQPQLDYNHAHLCDMEASAFYETAVRFTTNVGIASFKVVSDNADSPATLIVAPQASALIGAHLAPIGAWLNTANAMLAYLRTTESGLAKQLLQTYHFTANEQVQLTALLSRWVLVSNDQPLMMDESSLPNAKAVLRWLEMRIKDTDFYL